MDQTPDDIFALYSRFDLDCDNYRVFSNPSPADLLSVSSALEKAESPLAVAVEPPTAVPASGEGFRVSGVSDPEETKLILSEAEGVEPASFTSDRAALRSLWNHVRPAFVATQTVDTAALRSSSISIHGAAGGVGSTAIAAVLGRLLARSGRRCAIFDESESSALPIYFGTHKATADHRRFSGLYSVFQPGVRIVNRDMFEPASPQKGSCTGFLERNAGQLAHQFDHLIFDQPSRCTEDSGAGLLIYVAIPDVGSLIGARKLKESLEITSRQAICVLNRFDPSIPLHLEILSLYRANFSQVVIIHNSPLVSEALAEGTTVVEWAPRTKASVDFLNLFKIVSHQLALPGCADLNHSELFGLETERLPLCS